MADYIAAFKEAFAAFKKNIPGCLAYTFVFGFGCAIAVFMLAALTAVFGILSVGSLASVIATGNFSASLVLLGGALLILLLGVIIIAWLLSGMVGSYYDSMHCFLAGKKPTVIGFFMGIPKRATPIFLAEVLAALIIAIPVAVLGAVAALSGLGFGIAGIAISGLSGLYSAAISFLGAFIAASVVVEGKGALDSLKNSFARVSRNMVQVVIYALVCLILSLPIAFAAGVPVAISLFAPSVAPMAVQALSVLAILFSLAYVLFFFLPYAVLANLAVYRKLR